ncbi:MAG: PAS domain S-box protein [bacterium]
MVLSHRLSALFENSLDGILISHPSGRIDAANPAACRLLNRTEADILAAGRDGVLDRDDPRVSTGLAERAATGRYVGEATMIRGDGSRFPAELSSVICEDETGQPSAFVIFRDVSERHRTVAELHVARENLAAIIENSPAAMQGIGADGTVVFWNKAAERLFGWTASEVVGGSNPIVAPEHLEEYEELSGRTLAGQRLSGVEVRRTNKDGATIDVCLSTSAIKSADGEVIALVGVYEDLRPRKAAEAARIREEQVTALRELVVGLRHEMNNALAALRLEVEMLASGDKTTASDRISATTIVQLTDRLAGALNRLEHVDKLQSVPYHGDLRMLDLSGPGS